MSEECTTDLLYLIVFIMFLDTNILIYMDFYIFCLKIIYTFQIIISVLIIIDYSSVNIDYKEFF